MVDLLLDYFNLREMPFRLTPDERYFFASTEHNRAMTHLLFGLAQGDGFVVITGDVGSGKTTLMERMLARINPTSYKTAAITMPAASGPTLLRLIGAEFGIPHSPDMAEFLVNIRARWRSDLASGRRPIAVIDEAQTLSIPTLESLRLLSNLADRSRPLVQVILLGQPEFRRTLASPHLDQLRQRVLASYHLRPLAANEIGPYINHRLAVGGCDRDDLFAPDTFEVIHEATEGVPRRINRLCGRLLFNAAIEGELQITAETTRRIAEELERDLNNGLPSGAPPRSPNRSPSGSATDPSDPTGFDSDMVFNSPDIY